MENNNDFNVQPNHSNNILISRYKGVFKDQEQNKKPLENVIALKEVQPYLDKFGILIKKIREALRISVDRIAMTEKISDTEIGRLELGKMKKCNTVMLYLHELFKESGYHLNEELLQKFLVDIAQSGNHIAIQAYDPITGICKGELITILRK
ncbi:MAG TPA: hypothetical protein VIK42_03355 [Bacteroidales bacterium]